jgi:hypothetical protein
MGSVTLPGVRAMEMSVFTRLGGWQPSLHHNKKDTHVDAQTVSPLFSFFAHCHFPRGDKGERGLAYPMPP